MGRLTCCQETAILIMSSLQCRRFWWSIEWFAAILDSLQTGRIGARMTECRRNVGEMSEKCRRNVGEMSENLSLPHLGNFLPRPNSPLYQDGGLNSRWKYISTRPTKIRLHCRLDHEWQLNRVIFQKLTAVFPALSIDLFASVFNAQLLRYVSWNPDRYGTFVDAFSTTQTCTHAYCNC